MPEGTPYTYRCICSLNSDTTSSCNPSGHRSRPPLPDRHLLDHVGLARGRSPANANGGTGLLLEDLPELQALIGSWQGGQLGNITLGETMIKLTCCCQHLSVGAQAAVEDTALVGRDLDVADESGIAPDAERVVREATRADDLPVVGAPAEAGDLRTGVDAVDAGARGGVPEVDVTVV